MQERGKENRGSDFCDKGQSRAKECVLKGREEIQCV